MCACACACVLVRRGARGECVRENTQTKKRSGSSVRARPWLPPPGRPWAPSLPIISTLSPDGDRFPYTSVNLVSSDALLSPALRICSMGVMPVPPATRPTCSHLFAEYLIFSNGPFISVTAPGSKAASAGDNLPVGYALTTNVTVPAAPGASTGVYGFCTHFPPSPTGRRAMRQEATGSAAGARASANAYVRRTVSWDSRVFLIRVKADQLSGERVALGAASCCAGGVADQEVAAAAADNAATAAPGRPARVRSVRNIRVWRGWGILEIHWGWGGVPGSEGMWAGGAVGRV